MFGRALFFRHCMLELRLPKVRWSFGLKTDLLKSHQIGSNAVCSKLVAKRNRTVCFQPPSTTAKLPPFKSLKPTVPSCLAKHLFVRTNGCNRKVYWRDYSQGFAQGSDQAATSNQTNRFANRCWKQRAIASTYIHAIRPPFG